MGKQEVVKVKGGEILQCFLLALATWHLAGDSRATHGRPSYCGGCVNVLYPTPGKENH